MRHAGELVAFALVASGALSGAGSLAELRSAFRHPPDDSRIMMRWWWFGPAVTLAELEREMRAMRAAGIGGFEVQPVYPLSLDDARTGFRNLPYLSPGFLEALRFTARTARELGLRMDLTLGSGWPFGGPHIPVDQAASNLRIERVRVPLGAHRVPMPHLDQGEELLAAFVGDRRLPDVRDGAVTLPGDLALPGEVVFFISSRTGQMVKRASVGGEGFVLDHYDRRAAENQIKNVAAPLLNALGNHPPYAVFCDSLEVYGSDWTSDFPSEFRSRRGYDLLPWLPELISGQNPRASAIRYDWGRTLTELAEVGFIAPLAAWARSAGTRLRMQSYGIPPTTLSSNASVDLPEGEGAQWRTLTATRWASSANHLYGRPVTSSETWTWLHSPSFRATPLDLKAEADLHFLQGVNQLIGHGWPYSPREEALPGWRFYAAAALNDSNPWWIAMPDIARYLQRVSYVLRQGRPVSDVAVYLPNADAWAGFTPGNPNLLEALRRRVGPEVVGSILGAGYNLDFFDDRAIDKLAGRYRAVLLPGVEAIPPAALRALGSLAPGVLLMATRRLPETAPGFQATETDRQEVRILAKKLVLVADEEQGLPLALARQVVPDVAFAPAAPEIGFVHRSTEAAEIYFLANTGNRSRCVQATFRVAGLGAEWWDALTGRSAPGAVAARTNRTTTLALDLEPYGSRILVFSKEAVDPGVPATAPKVPAPVDISEGWRVSFGGNPVVLFDHLRSWTDRAETHDFSGVAAYEHDFEMPPAFRGFRVSLDFGEGTPVPKRFLRNGTRAWLDAPVRDAAVVYVNGRRAAAVWCPPWRAEITDFVAPGPNALRIVVGNLAVNAMAARPLPDYRLLNLRYGVRFEPQDMDKLRAEPSGLLGPVRVVAE